MKKVYSIAALSLMCFLGVVVSAHAQDIDAVVVTVSFEFVAGGATLPGGQYRVSRNDSSSRRELAIRSSSQGGAILLPMEFDGVAADKATLNFEHVGDKYFLSKIKTLSGVYTMATSPEMIRLGQMSTPGTMFSSGTH